MRERNFFMQRSHADQEHFVISYELLKLLQWLIEHEQEPLKKLLKQSLNRKSKQGTATAATQQIPADHLQINIIHFFSLLETLIHEIEQENEIRHVSHATRIPAIHHIDTNICDSESVALSIAKATDAAENQTGENLKDVLCKELLRRWKPEKKPSIH